MRTVHTSYIYSETHSTDKGGHSHFKKCSAGPAVVCKTIFEFEKGRKSLKIGPKMKKFSRFKDLDEMPSAVLSSTYEMVWNLKQFFPGFFFTIKKCL